MKFFLKQKNKKITAKLEEQSRGFMMIEIIVAASIITIFILAAMSVAQKSITLSGRTIHTAQASFLLEEGAEAVKLIRNNGWSNISSLDPNNTYNLVFNGSAWSLATPVSDANKIGIFTRTVNISTVKRDGTSGDISSSGTNDDGTRFITVTVSFPEEGQTIDKTLKFYITDFLQ